MSLALFKCKWWGLQEFAKLYQNVHQVFYIDIDAHLADIMSGAGSQTYEHSWAIIISIANVMMLW